MLLPPIASPRTGAPGTASTREALCLFPAGYSHVPPGLPSEPAPGYSNYPSLQSHCHPKATTTLEPLPQRLEVPFWGGMQNPSPGAAAAGGRHQPRSRVRGAPGVGLYLYSLYLNAPKV